MPEFWWKSTDDAYTAEEQAAGRGKLGPVNEQHPLPLQLMWRAEEGDEWEVVNADHGLPVTLTKPGPGPYFDASWGVVTAKSLKPIHGKLLRFIMINRNAAVRYGNIHNKSSIPLATEVPLISLPIPAGTANNPGVLSVDIAEGQLFSNGIGWSISTVEAVFTDSATASEHTTHVWFE